MAAFPSDDQLKSIRVLLELLVLIANVAVWYGVYLERDEFSKETQDKGWFLLIKGLAAELAFGAFLFVADTMLSDRQAAELSSEKVTVADTTKAAATLGVTLSNLSSFVRDRQKEAISSINSLRDAENSLSKAIERSNKQLAPRDISEAKLQSLALALKTETPFALDIWVSASGNAQESLRLASIIESALLKAGFHPDVIAGVAAPTSGIYVMELEPTQQPQQPAIANAAMLLFAIKNTGLQVSPAVGIVTSGPYGALYLAHLENKTRSDLDAAVHTVILFIGPKPDQD